MRKQTRKASGRFLPWRDFWLLPLISLATALTMLAASEVGARIAFPRQTHDSCRVTDAIFISRVRGQCVSRVKQAEGPWTTNRYNECGFMAESSCRSKPAGATRWGVIGSSLSMAYYIPFQDNFAVRAAAATSRTCGHPIDVQNAAGLGWTYNLVAARLGAVLATRPDALLMATGPTDLERIGLERFDPDFAARPTRFRDTETHSLARDLVASSRAVLMLQHAVYRQPSKYIPLFLHHADDADYLRRPWTPAWRARLRYADDALTFIAAKAKAAGVPFILVFSPDQMQSYVVMTKTKLDGVYPFQLSDALAQIARRRGIIFVDPLRANLTVGDPADLHFNVEGHMSPLGHQFQANALIERLRNDRALLEQVCRVTP